MVTNIRVERLTDTSVRVRWDRITAVQEITQYRVYFSQTGGRKRQGGGEGSVTVPSANDSAVVMGLAYGVAYQFQVVAIAIFEGVTITGERSPVTPNTTFTIPIPTPTVAVVSRSEYNRSISISVVVTFFLTALLNTTVLMVVWAVWRSHSASKGRE